MTIQELNYKLTGIENPRYLTNDQKMVIEHCLVIINEIEQSHKHGVMQAEASGGAEGAAVGNSAAGQSGRAVKVKTGTVIFCEGEQFIFGINRKTGKAECFNLYGMSGISDEEALPR